MAPRSVDRRVGVDGIPDGGVAPVGLAGCPGIGAVVRRLEAEPGHSTSNSDACAVEVGEARAVPAVSDEETGARVPNGWMTVKLYLRVVPQPS